MERHTSFLWFISLRRRSSSFASEDSGDLSGDTRSTTVSFRARFEDILTGVDSFLLVWLLLLFLFSCFTAGESELERLRLLRAVVVDFFLWWTDERRLKCLVRCWVERGSWLGSFLNQHSYQNTLLALWRSSLGLLLNPCLWILFAKNVTKLTS